MRLLFSIGEPDNHIAIRVYLSDTHVLILKDYMEYLELCRQLEGMKEEIVQSLKRYENK